MNCVHATPITLKGIGLLAALHFAYFPLEWVLYYAKVTIEPQLMVPLMILSAGSFAYIWTQTNYELKNHKCKVQK